MTRHTVGLSVGPPSETTGLVVVESSDADPPMLAVRHLQRFAPGTGYREIVDAVGRVLLALDGPVVVLDCTAVGEAIAARFEWPNAWTRRVILTAGEATGSRIPRQDVAAKLLLALQDGRITVAAGPLAPALGKDLRTFNPRPSVGAASELAWRDRPSDDLVLALAVALLEAERGPVCITVLPRSRPRRAVF